jgi:hypothetical protein
MELHIGVSLPPQPRPFGPRQVVQTRVSILMQDRTQIHKSFWSRDQRCQDVWSNRIHCENMRQAVFSDNSLWLLVADAGVTPNEALKFPDLNAERRARKVIPLSFVPSAHETGISEFVG